MTLERKCPSCNKWNTSDHSNCEFCNAVIDPFEIIRQDYQLRATKREESKGKVDRFFEQFSASKNPLIKFIYIILKSVWIVYAAILTFFLWLIAMTPG